MIVYVKGGELKATENDLRHKLNEARYRLGNITIRTDPEDSDSKRVAEEWAAIRNIPVQHHGRPITVFVPGFPLCMQGKGNATMRHIDSEARQIGEEACRVPGESLIHRLLNIRKRPHAVVWLGGIIAEKALRNK